MLNELTLFFLQYLLVLISCVTCYLLGRILLKIFPLDIFNENYKWSRSYAAIILGMVTAVLVYSLLLAKCKTINILILPILLCLFFKKRKENAYNNSTNVLKDWPVLFFVTVPFFFVLLVHLFPESEFKQYDSLFYLQVSQSFNTNGQENIFGGTNLFGKPFVGTVPYHYFELWLNAILLKCFGNLLPSIQVLRFVCYSIISTAGLLGLFALCENILKNQLTFLQILLCFCFIFYLPNFLGFFDFLKPVFIYAFDSNAIERPNLRTLYLFLPGILIMMDSKIFKWQTIFWLICLMISSVLNFVVFFSAIILFSLFSMFKKQDRKYATSILITVISTGLFYFIFYYVTSTKLKITSDEITPKNLIAYFFRYWKIILFSSITSIFNCLIVPIVFLGLIRIRKKELFAIILRKNETILIFICTIIICAIGVARALNLIDNAYQFAFIGYSFGAVLFLILILSVFKKLKSSGRLYYLSCVVFFLSFLIPRYFFHPTKYSNVFEQNGNYTYNGKKFTQTYLHDLLSAFPSGTKVNGAFWADSLYYDTVSYYSNRNPNAYTLPSGYVLAGKLKYNYEVCLSDSASIMYGVDTAQKLSYNYLKSSILRSPFYQYPNQTDINAKRLSLIKRYNLKYLILTENADTSIIKQLAVSKHFHDRNTGERFYLIDNK